MDERVVGSAPALDTSYLNKTFGFGSVVLPRHLRCLQSTFFEPDRVFYVCKVQLGAPSQDTSGAIYLLYFDTFTITFSRMPLGAIIHTARSVKQSIRCAVLTTRPLDSLLCTMNAQVEELPETASRTIAAEWGAQTAGGSHIHPDWKKNPCFHLKLRTTGPAKASKMLSIAVFSRNG